MGQHHNCRGFWEMTPKLMLLILALTANLITQVHCEKEIISGDGTSETNEIDVTSHSPAVTNLQWETGHTVYIKKDVTKHAESYAQAALPRVTSVTSSHITNSTQTQNRTQKQNPTVTTGGTVKNAPVNKNNTGGRIADLAGPPQATKSTVESKVTDAPNSNEDAEEPYVFIIILVSLLLSLVLTAMVVAAVLISKKRRKDKSDAVQEDLYLDAEGTEKVPMPMFEDDVPSVMELEMEDLEKWMIKGNCCEKSQSSTALYTSTENPQQPTG